MDKKNTIKQKKRKRLLGDSRIWILTSVSIVLLAVIVSMLSVFLHRPDVDDDPPFTDAPSSDLPTATDDAYVRKDGYYTFLLAGMDDVSMSTDVLMLASLDTKSGEVHVVQIPRDTFINKTVGGYKNISRVNGIFNVEYHYQRNQGESVANAKKLAMNTLKKTLETTLCVKIDEYVLIDTNGFCAIIDAIGGIYYDVPRDMFYEDPEQDLYIHLEKGYQHLDGKACEGLIRYRAGYATGDIGRVDLRENFLVEAFRQVKENLSMTKLIGLIPTFFDHVKTSMSTNDMIAYAKKAYAVDAEHIYVRTLGGSVIQNPNTGAWIYYCLNKTAALADVNECLNVYEDDIDASLFDKKGFFTDTENANNAYIHEYYSSEP